VPLQRGDEARHDLERLPFVQGGRGKGGREGWTRGTNVEGSVQTRRGHCEGFLVGQLSSVSLTFTVTGCTRKSTGSR
jgi:hypothetical protein